MHWQRGPGDTVVDAALVEWRRKASNIFLAASAVAYLPAIVLLIAGKGPPLTMPVFAAVMVAYGIVLFGALRRRINHEARVWAMLAAAYGIALLGNIAVPEGPFTRAFPVILPMLAMVLLGARPGRAATVVSAAILLCAPQLHHAPAFVGTITTPHTEAPIPASLLLTQGAGLTAMLLAVMILLDRFHQLLVDSLTNLEREATERSAAHRSLEHEMIERQRLERELAEAGDEERRRLGIDIHDGVCQQLTGALLRCEALARHFDRGEIPAADDLTALSSLLEETIDEAHAIARGLWPLEAKPGALATALRRLAKQTQGTAAVPCRFITTGDVSVVNPMTARHLYRIAQEAVSNAARHAHGGKIIVELHGEDHELLLQVEDDGVGVPHDHAGTGMGLRTMAYRARLLEGDFALTSAPAGGTRVSCRVPRGTLSPPEKRHGETREAVHEQ